MPDIDKRLRYFNGQFLKANDFTNEQNYHIDRLERHTRLMHTPGVAGGLAVTGDQNTPQVTVGSGTAIDGNGKQIVLVGDRTVRVDRDELKGRDVLIVISYGEVDSDLATVGAQEATRVQEVPTLAAVLASSNPSEAQFIRLASASVNAQGNLVDKPKDIRQKAGQPTIADGAIAEIKLDPTVRAKLVNNGNTHDHTAGNGGRIRHSSLDLSDAGTNPHNTTAADVKALPLTGGILSGPVTLNGAAVLRARMTVQTNTAGSVTGVAGGPVISNLGSAFVLNTAKDSYALVAKVSDTADVLPGRTAIPAAAFVAISGFDGSPGIYAMSKVGTPAVIVEGDVSIKGNLSKSGGTFRIDHPLDPANKYLNHSFVESPDMKNIYDGVVTLDVQGEAVVALPLWFDALNQDLRYQLTCIGGYAPVYIAQEVQDNQFTIAGGVEGLKVSWQVTGVRQDAWAKDHRVPVEEFKPAEQRGTYLYREGDRALALTALEPCVLVEH
jgi:hypothetical protein